MSPGSGLTSLPPLSPRRLSPMSPGIAPGSSLKPLLAPKSPLPPSPRSPFSSHKPMIYVPPRESCRSRPRRSCGSSNPGGKTWRPARRTRAATTSSRKSPTMASREARAEQSGVIVGRVPEGWVDTLRTPTKAERLVHRYSSVNTINPVLQRQMELSRRRREAVTKWTPPKEKRTKAKRKPALPTFNTKRTPASSSSRRLARRDAPRPWTSTARSPCSPRRCPGRWRRARLTRKTRGGTSAEEPKATRRPPWRWWRMSRRCPRCRGRGRRTRTSQRTRGTRGISTTGSRVRARRRAGVIIQRGRTSGRGTSGQSATGKVHGLRRQRRAVRRSRKERASCYVCTLKLSHGAGGVLGS